jgi:hypothetical protein
MKPTLAALAVLVLLAGCAAKEELQSSGTESDTSVKSEQPAKDAPDATIKPAISSATNGTTGTVEPPQGTTGPTTEQTSPASGDATMKSLAAKYDGKVEIPPSSIDAAMAQVPENQKQQAAAFMQQMVEMIKKTQVELELLADGNYNIKTTGQGKSETEKGKWLTGPKKDQITLKAPDMSQDQIDRAKKAGMTEEQIKQMRNSDDPLDVKDGGKQLVLTKTQNGVTIIVTFSRK